MADELQLEQKPAPIFIPASRTRALTRVVIWGAAGVLLFWLTFLIYGQLNFKSTGLSNRLFDYSVAVLACPLAIFAVILTTHAIRWLMIAIWPSRLGFTIEPERLRVRLLLFGTFDVEAHEMAVMYPYDLLEEMEEGSFEAYLPEDQQHATIVPRIEHRSVRGKINLQLVTFSGRPEPELARQLHQHFIFWKSIAHAGADHAG